MNQQRIINCALDTVTRFGASKYPLKNVAQDVIKARKLNSQERKALSDIVFSWSRHRYLIEAYLAERVKSFAALSQHNKESFSINLLAQLYYGFELKMDINLVGGYEAYLAQLGDTRWLLALGPLVHEELIKSLGSDSAKIAKSLWQAPAKYLAYLPNKISQESLRLSLGKIGLNITVSPLTARALKIDGSPGKLKLPAHVWFMDAGSQFIASLIKPKPGDAVLDMCIGEGGKARIISQYDCVVSGIDIDQARLEKARAVMPGKTNLLCVDAKNSGLKKQSFDWILLDAPCSGSGVIRRHPDLIHRLTKKDLNSYQALQRDLLKEAANLLKPGGVLIYATCSLFSVENDEQITRLLQANSNLMPLSLKNLVDEHEVLDPLVLNKNSLLLVPHLYDCDAFFVASLRRR